MKRTPLKRGTKPLKRSPIEHKAKRYPIPQKEIDKVDERSEGKCEYTGTRVISLQIAHIVHRRMGGVQMRNAHIINDHRNMAKVSGLVHDIIDGRVKEHSGFKRKDILDFLKDKIGWYDWQKEFNIPVKDGGN